MDEPSAVAVIVEHHKDAYGFTMKMVANGLLHRVLPLRDPDQPRFWCVVVVRCAPGGLPDRAEGAWIGPRGLRRDELGETMGAIRADLEAWLTEESQARLREWLLAAPATAVASAMPAAGKSGAGARAPGAARSAST